MLNNNDENNDDDSDNDDIVIEIKMTMCIFANMILLLVLSCTLLNRLCEWWVSVVQSFYKSQRRMVMYAI